MMNNLKTLFLITLITVIFLNNGMAGINVDSTKYTKDFVFTDGIYLKFMSWKTNNPITLDNIITDEDKTAPEFYENLLSKSSLTFYDEDKKIHVVKSKKIFGYCKNNMIYTQRHFQINIIGSMCLYTETIVPSDIERTANTAAISANRHYLNYEVIRLKKGAEMKSFVIDFERNKRYKFTRKNFERMLKRDKVLYKTYRKAKGKKKTKMQEYLLKYNEKHPAYLFPID